MLRNSPKVHLPTLFKKPYPYLLIILIGLLLKFYGLDSKFKWLDEVFTMSHCSGKGMVDFEASLPRDTLMSIEEFNGMLDMNNGNYALSQQLVDLTQMVQVTPGHYFLLVFWHRLAGGDLVDYRLFSLLAFILSIPLLYQLVKELSDSKTVGYVAASLFSVAPFLHFYALEARYYSLWGLAIILVSLVLIRALKHNNAKWWILYGLSAVFAMYVSTLSILILGGHLAYVVIFHRDKWLRFGLTGAGVFLCYLPWIIAMNGSKGEIFGSTSWQYGSEPVWKILAGPLYSMATTFFTSPSDKGFWAAFRDLENHSTTAVAIQTVLIGLILVAGVYGARHISKRALWFNFFTVIGFLLVFWGFDLYSGRTLSMVYRYHIPIMISAVIILSVYLGQHIEQGKVPYIALFLVPSPDSAHSILTRSRPTHATTTWAIATINYKQPLQLTWKRMHSSSPAPIIGPLAISFGKFHRRLNHQMWTSSAIHIRTDSQNI